MDKERRIPEDLSQKFDTVDGRREMIAKYGDSPNLYVGENADGEKVFLCIDRERGIECRTHQHNGWCRVNYYDKDGFHAGETFDGRWDK